MNIIKNLRYHIHTIPSQEQSTLEEKISSLLSKINPTETVFRLVFFDCPANNQEYVNNKTLIIKKVKEKFGKKMPALSLVAQPPIHDALILEIQSFIPQKEDQITFSTIDQTPYVTIENEDARFIFAGGFQADVVNNSIDEQSKEVFKQLGKLLQKEKLEIHNIIRQWNYMELITDQDQEGNQHYQLFNNARTAFYSKTEWDNGYPAATGIGTDLGGILVEIDAIVPKKKTVSITPIDNKLQVAAHVYSDQVLIQANNHKSTPKFERAKSLEIEQNKLIYISGTAAIRGEESLTDVGLEKQLHITMENIAELIGDSKIKLLRVYLKHSECKQETVRLMEEYNLTIPISYLYADVCRDELLIEIEGIAIN